MSTQLDDILSVPLGREQPSQEAGEDKDLVYGRVRSMLMVGICCAALLLNNGFMLIGVSVFDPLMMRRLGVSIGVLKVGDTITLATVALAAPLAGYLIDRLGPRPLFVTGMALMAAGMMLYAASTSITMLYLIHVLFGLCLVFSGAFACLIVVSAASRRWRGLAIGLLLASASFGSAIAPTILSRLRDLFGWQEALHMLAAATACLLPAIAILVPMRLRIGGGAACAPGEMPTLKGALRSRDFWFLAMVAAIGYMTALGITSNMVLFLARDLGLASAGVNRMMLVLFVTVLCAQLGIGYSCDILNRRAVHASCIVMMALGCLLLASAPGPLLWLGLVLLGIGWGGNYVLLQYLLTHLFSGPSVGRIIGTIGVVEALGGSFGPVMIGASHDWRGTYSPAFAAAALLLVLAALLASRINRPSDSGRARA